MIKTLEKLNNLLSTQASLDILYDEMCSNFILEMDSWLKFRDLSRQTRKKLKSQKPYWNENLMHLWNNMRDSENIYLKNKTIHWMKENYKRDRNIFDKAL